jgi:uncharacterized membrane protein YkoI
MLVFRILTVALLLNSFAAPAVAADAVHQACLSKAEQRAAVADKKAIPLAKAIQNRRAKGHFAELVRARLCHREDRLVYMLTLLGRSGRVISETVDAANGELINER